MPTTLQASTHFIILFIIFFTQLSTQLGRKSPRSLHVTGAARAGVIKLQTGEIIPTVWGGVTSQRCRTLERLFRFRGGARHRRVSRVLSRCCKTGTSQRPQSHFHLQTEAAEEARPRKGEVQFEATRGQCAATFQGQGEKAARFQPPVAPAATTAGPVETS